MNNTGGQIAITGPLAIIMNGGEIQALGPRFKAFADISAGVIIQSSDRSNSIQVQGTLDLNSEIVDVSQAVTQPDVGFDDASKVLRGQCPVLRARGETSQFGSTLSGPYPPAVRKPLLAPARPPPPSRVASLCDAPVAAS